MAIKIVMCPRCGNLLHKKDAKCSQCGLSREKIESLQKRTEARDISVNAQSDVKSTESLNQSDAKSKEIRKAEAVSSSEDGGVTINTLEFLDKENANAQTANNPSEEQGSKEASSERSSEVKTETGSEKSDGEEGEKPVSYEQGIDSSNIGKVVYDKPKRHKHKSKQKNEPEYTVDENGEYNIDTSDVTYLEGAEAPTYSVKKARGEVKQEKLKWWEIYKWADRMLARRKISKEVNKASTKTPTGINRVSMIIWCIFFGYLGIHNFYAHNFKRGWFVLVSFVIVVLVTSINVLTEIMGVFVGGGLGFIIFAMWLIDLIALIFGRYKYRISKEEFISNLNVETRAKLGKIYIGLDRAEFKAREEKRLSKLNKKKKKVNG